MEVAVGWSNVPAPANGGRRHCGQFAPRSGFQKGKAGGVSSEQRQAGVGCVWAEGVKARGA